YERNDPPFGWSVERTTRHGSALNRNSSRPIAHCSDATAALSLNASGTIPQPVSSSMSMLVHRRPLLLCRRYSTGASAVIVIAGPNITWPTSVLTSGWALTYSITCEAADFHPCPGSPP